MSDIAYTEDYLFTVWALRNLPYPLNTEIQIRATSTYGYIATRDALPEEYKHRWEIYREHAKNALGERFIEYKG